MRLNWNNIGAGLGVAADEYTQYKVARDVEKLGKEGTVTKGRGLDVTDAEGNTSMGVIDKDVNIDAVDPQTGTSIRKQYEDAGYNIGTTEAPRYAARSGSRDLGLSLDEREATTQAREFNYGRRQDEVAIYDKHGLRKEARDMRKELRRDRMADVADDRDERRMGLAEDANRRQNVVSDQQTDAFEHAKDRRGVTDAMQDDEATLKAVQARGAVHEEGYKLARQGGLDSLVQWYDKIDDGVKVTLGRGKKGELIINRTDEATGKPMTPWPFAGTKDMSPDDQALMFMDMKMTKGGGVELAKLELEKTKAEAYANNQNAQASYARSGKGANDSAAGMQRDIFNNYAAHIKQQNPTWSDAQVKMEAFKAMQNDRSQRDIAPMSPKETYELRTQVESNLASKVKGWKDMSAPAKAELINRELATVMPSSGRAPAADPYAPLLQGGGKPAGQPTAAPAGQGLRAPPPTKPAGPKPMTFAHEAEETARNAAGEERAGTERHLAKLTELFNHKSAMLGDAVREGDEEEANRLQAGIELLNRQIHTLREKAGTR